MLPGLIVLQMSNKHKYSNVEFFTEPVPPMTFSHPIALALFLLSPPGSLCSPNCLWKAVSTLEIPLFPFQSWTLLRESTSSRAMEGTFY